MPVIQSDIALLPASAFTYEELTEAYNHTRVDYIVPMPMNAARLREYVITYDIDLEASVVAVDGTEILGLSMLGLRAGRAWITRLSGPNIVCLRIPAGQSTWLPRMLMSLMRLKYCARQKVYFPHSKARMHWRILSSKRENSTKNE